MFTRCATIRHSVTRIRAVARRTRPGSEFTMFQGVFGHIMFPDSGPTGLDARRLGGVSGATEVGSRTAAVCYRWVTFPHGALLPGPVLIIRTCLAEASLKSGPREPGPWGADRVCHQTRSLLGSRRKWIEDSSEPGWLINQLGMKEIVLVPLTLQGSASFGAGP